MYFFTAHKHSDKGCNSKLATFTADGNGNTKEGEVKAGTVYIKKLSAPKGYKLDSTVHALKVGVGKTAILTFAAFPKVTETKVPNSYLLDGAYMQVDGSSEI